MVEFLYRIQPTRPEMLSERPTESEGTQVTAHFQYLQSLLDNGQLILAGRTLNTDPSAFGVVIFRAESDAAARKVMEADPAVTSGVMRAELFHYRVALMEKQDC